MAILDYDFNKVPEVVILPDGEYELRIKSVEDKISKKSGTPMLRICYTVMSDPNADDIFEYLSIPTDQTDEATKVKQLRRFKHLIQAFHIAEPNDTETWVGATGYALLTTECDEQYGDRNRVSRYSAGQ
ncbi:MAG: DUF669 domain-containing protein [Oscillospiraceae bacterium]